MNWRRRLRSSCSLPVAQTGTELFLKSRWFIRLRWCLRLFFVFGAISYSFSEAESWLADGMTTDSLASTSFVIGCFITNIHLMMNRKRMEKLILTLTSVLRSQTVRSLYWQNMVIFVIMTVSNFLEVCRQQQLKLYDYKSGDFWDRLGLAGNAVADFVMEWIPGQATFYWMTVQMLFLYQRRILSGIIRVSCTGDSDFRHFRSSLSLIRSVAQEFDDLFSILPLMWFFNQFVSCPNSILNVLHATKINKWEVLYNVLRYHVMPLVMVYFMSRLQDGVNHDVDRTIDRASDLKGLTFCQINFMIRELESIKSIKLTGMSFFVLDKSFLLSYIGTVLTFAALIATYARET